MASGRATEEINDFDDLLCNLPYKHKVVVAGNQDLLFESKPEQVKEHLSNAVYLQDSGVTLERLNFWGCPVTPFLPYMAFAVERGAASKRHWDKIPQTTDVLITHGPPFGILDKEDIVASHMRCEQLGRAVQRVRPKLHVFGHVHGGYGARRAQTGPAL